MAAPSPEAITFFRRIQRMKEDCKNQLYLRFGTKRKDSPRFLDRSKILGLSFGRFNIRRVGQSFYFKWGRDWFHSLVHTSTVYLILICIALYLLLALISAVLFYLSNTRCNLGFVRFLDAMYFSVYTLGTIGYGANDNSFGGCYQVATIMSLEVFMAFIIQSLMLGLLFSRLGRASLRASTVVFSNSAIIREINGRLFLMVRICDLRKHQMAEPAVKCLAVRHRVLPDGSQIPFQTYKMRLVHPDDTVDSLVLLALPTVIVHEIDEFSPLFPPRESLEPVRTAFKRYQWPNLMSREADPWGGNRASDSCRACGNTFVNEKSLMRHIEYSRLMDLISFPDGSRPHEEVYGSEDLNSHDEFLPRFDSMKVLKQHIRNFLKRSDMEIVVFVEATDGSTSGNVQARCSYKLNDIEWDQMFAPCVSHNSDDDFCEIDFLKFHDLIPIS